MGSVRLGTALEEKVRQVAAKKGITRSEVFREALEEYCDRELTPPQKSRFADVIGVIDVPGDLSARTREVFGEIRAEKQERKRGA